MTTQTTTIRSNAKGARAFIGAAAASLAVLGGALLWQARPTSETAAPVVATSTSTVNEGVAPMGGLAEQYRDAQQAQATRDAAQVTTTGGMAEFYAQQEADRFADEAARMSALGGVDAPYRASTRSTCGTREGGLAC